MLGNSQHQGDGSAALQGLGMQGIRKGWDHFGEEMASGDVVQGTCSLQASCNEQPVPPARLFSKRKRKCQTIKPEGNLIKTDERKLFHMYSKSLAGGTHGHKACLRMWI